LIPGTRAHGQARSLLPLWEPLVVAFKALESTGQDVIIDAGRLGLSGSPESLIYAGDLTLLVVRSDLVSLSGARSWAETLRAGFERVGGSSSLGLLMVGKVSRTPPARSARSSRSRSPRRWRGTRRRPTSSPKGRGLAPSSTPHPFFAA